MTAKRQISAGGVVFRKNSSGVEVALISVREGKPWALPKGLVEEGESLARTAHREVKEETGLDGKILKKIDSIKYFFNLRDDGEVKRYFKIVYFFLMEYTGGDITRHDDEVLEVRWFPIDKAVELMRFEDEKEIIRKARKMLAGYGYLQG